MRDHFDINKLPERRIGVRNIVVINHPVHVDDLVRSVKLNMAMKLATKMMEGEPFFREIADTVGGEAMVEYIVDCIVLTSEEHADIKREAFKEGVKHAQACVGLMEVR